MVDIHTVGAGGGSIGWRDPGGALRVGPRSAGAEPGPASYGRGGTEPTSTFTSAGTHKIRMHVVGKNASSTSFQLSADKFTFTAQ